MNEGRAAGIEAVTLRSREIPGREGVEVSRNRELKGEGEPTTTESLRRRGDTNHRGGEKPETLARMASQRASQRKNLGAEGGSIAPISLSKIFEEDDEIMEIDSLAQTLKRHLEETNKNKGGVQGKRTRESTKASPRQMDPAEETDSAHLTKF